MTRYLTRDRDRAAIAAALMVAVTLAEQAGRALTAGASASSTG